MKRIHVAVVFLLAAGVGVFFFCEDVTAQPFKQAIVVAEYQAEEDTRCNLRKDAARVAVQSVLRSHHVTLAGAPGSTVMKIYVNFTTVSLGSACAVGYRLEFKDYGSARVPGTNYSRPANLVFCAHDGVLVKTGPSHDLQFHLSSAFRELTEKCLSEMER